VLIADISGHGVGPGLIMGMLKSCVRTRAAVKSSTQDDLASIADDVRRTLEGLLEPGRFATLAWVRVHHARSQSQQACDGLKIEVIMAGHPPVLVMRAGGTLERFESEQAPIGAGMDDALTVRSSTLMRGDVLLLTTDGLAETFNKSGEILGFHAVEKGFIAASTTSLEKSPPHTAAPTPREMNPKHRAAMIRDYMLSVAAQHGKQTDDRSVLVVARG
jgi:serine phosphatase RsbU (regulator of sigma subunit)